MEFHRYHSNPTILKKYSFYIFLGSFPKAICSTVFDSKHCTNKEVQCG